MSPLTQKQIREAEKRKDIVFFLDYVTSRLGFVMCTLGILYLAGHIVLWYLGGMKVPH